MAIIVYMNENILEHTVLNSLFHIVTFYPTENIFVWQPRPPIQLYYQIVTKVSYYIS